MRGFRPALIALAAASLTLTLVQMTASAQVNQRGDGWPDIDGMLLINSHHGSRPLDARPGRDPFMGTDNKYRCLGKEPGGSCLRFLEACGEGRRCVKDQRVHNELLGGHGNDKIFGGPHGDVMWADYLPGGPKRQRDRIRAGSGKDFIYGGPGRNVIRAGKGDDFVKSRYGRGRIDCGEGNDILYTSRRFKSNYEITRCERQSVGPSPGQGGSPTR